MSVDEPYHPAKLHEVGMYMDNQWYRIVPKQGTWDEHNVVENLDFSILQKNLLHPILGIEDPRTDKED
jgi:uncharacterized protein (DUF1015 family)